ncbi:MAG: hypothetical protein D6719_03355 [Candidatus Dadabacteria bacterium]|nr:MAG: hypothetical protein D6719_03355 [Candidatus Dadabacteria bacterium]
MQVLRFSFSIISSKGLSAFKRNVRNLFFTLLLIAALSPNAFSQSIDASGDGYSDLYYYHAFKVHAFKSDGTHIGSVDLPQDYLSSKKPVVFAGKYLAGEPFSVASIKLPKKGSATLYILGSSGLAKTLTLSGVTRKFSLLAFDFDGNGLTDIAAVSKRGAATVFLNPGATLSIRSLRVAKGRRNYYIPVVYGGQAAIASFKRRGRRVLVYVHNIAGAQLAKIAVGKLAGQPMYLTGAFVLLPQKFAKRGVKYSAYNIQTGESIAFSVKPDRILSPGQFAAGSSLQIAEGKDRDISIVDIVSGATLSEITLEIPGVDQQDQTGGETVDPCDLNYLKGVLLQSFSIGDFDTFNSTIESMVFDCNYQPDFVGDLINDLLFGGGGGGGNGGGNDVPSEYLLRDATYSPFGSKGASSTGCDKIKPGSDGQDGFLWKPVSESTGKLVVLLPSGFFASSVTIIRADGSKVKGGKGVESGIANGFRQHWRFSKPGRGYPNNVLVKAVQTYGGSGTVCWKIKRSAARND